MSLGGAPEPYILIDMDCSDLPIRQSDQRCDFVFVSDDGNWVVPLELKSGNPDAGTMVDQLRAGARFAEEVVPRDIEVQFQPIAVFGGKFHGNDRRRFRQPASMVSFRGFKVRIELLRCGAPLINALKG